MGHLTKYLALVGGVSLAMSSGKASMNAATFESLDGHTVLLVADGYYYLGPKNHPADRDFLKQYGQRAEYQQIPGGRCLALGVFKIAALDVNRTTCQVTCSPEM